MIGAAIGVCAFREARHAIISLWLGQLAGGALILDAGAEALAVLLWISSTLVAGVYFLHADVFAGQAEPEGASIARAVAAKAFPASASIGVGVVVWALLEHAVPMSGTARAAGPLVDMDERFVLAEIIAGLALAATVASGVITRASRARQDVAK
jgi:hypothetical protein